MEYILLAIVLLQGGAITYLINKKKPSTKEELTKKEKERQERIEKDLLNCLTITKQ